MNTIDSLQVTATRRTGVASVIALGIVAFAGTARADLLTKQRWNNGTPAFGWTDDYRWLAGDFDGNGKTDIAHVYGFCDGNCDVHTGIDVYASCGGSNAKNPSATCPAGIPKSTQAGTFVPQHWINSAPVVQGFDGCYNASGFPFTCQESHGSLDMWAAGDFNGDGLSDLAVLVGEYGNSPANFGLGVFISTGNSFRLESYASGQGGFIGESQLIAGDFDGDGVDELAYIFDDGAAISIDLHRLNAATGRFDLGPERWVTQQGSYVAWPWGIFEPADVNGDGSTDIVLVFPDANGNRNLDAHLSCKTAFTPASNCPGNSPTFALQRWASGQGVFPTGAASFTSAAATGPYVGLNVSMVPLTAFSIDPKAGLGGIILAYPGGVGFTNSISIDVHLAQMGTSFGLPGADGFFNLVTYEGGQGAFLNTQTFLAGDFNGDEIGDVADPFKDTNGDIDVDVHLGTCNGGVTSSGQCCTSPQYLCNGVCTPAGQSCNGNPPR
jgi:hypothetical protein